MKLIKTYKYKLKLNKSQINTFDKWIGTCRYVYNLAKETKTEAYKSGVNLHKFDLIKQLTELRRDVKWVESVPCGTLQCVIERLDNSYQSYFSKIKSGEIKQKKSEYITKKISKGLDINHNKLRDFGKPKWAKQGEYNSISFKYVKQTERGFILPKIGEVKIFKGRMPVGKLKTPTVKKENGSYYIYVVFEYQSQNLYPTNENQVVGIDMGITYFAVDSNDCFVENQRNTKKYEKQLRVKNRSLARKQKGSVNFNRVKAEVGKLHRKISETRKDFLHKVSTNYVKENSLIVCEDLKVTNMIKSGHLNKHILDASWSNFFEMVRYKSLAYEKEFIQINPMYTSMKCNECGHISSENRKSQSKFCCVKCGNKENADFNAAKNILGEGIALKRKRDALACA